jgi:hypothetical protein
MRGDHPLMGDADILFNNFSSKRPSVLAQCGNRSGSYSHIGVEHPIARIREGQHKPLNQFNWKLARMNCLLDMIMLDIRDDPEITRILSKRIA